MNRLTWRKRTALACIGLILAGCATSRDQYSQSSGITPYGVVDVGVERTSR